MTYRTPYCWNEGQPNSYCYYLEEDRLVQSCYYGCEDGDCIAQNCDEECSINDKRCIGNVEQSCGRYDADACKEYPSSTSGDGNDDCTDCSCNCGNYNAPEVDPYCTDGKDNDCDGLIDDNDAGCGGVVLDIDWENVFGSGGEQGNSVVKVYGGYMAAGYTNSGADSYLAKTGDSGSVYWYFNKGYTQAHSIVELGTYTSLLVGSTTDHYALEENPYTGDLLFLGGSNIYVATVDYNGGQTEVDVYGERTSVNMDTNEYGYDIVPTASGASYIIAGMSSATGNLWKKSAYVFWISDDGTKAWDAQYLIMDGENAAYSIARKDFDFFITGYAAPYQIDQDNIYILKLNFQGTKQWSETYGLGRGYSIEYTADDGLIVAGVKEGYSYLLKTDISGNKDWDMTLDTGEATSVKVDSNGDYIVLANHNSNIQIYKVLSSGDVLWKKTFVTTNTDIGKDIIVDGQRYVVTGRRDNNLYMMATKVPCIAECSQGAIRCNGDYKQTCGNYDSDTCTEWPASTSGGGNEYCTYGCNAGQCIVCNTHEYLSCNNNDVYWYDSCDNLEDKKEDCGSHSCESAKCVWNFTIDLKKDWNLFSLPMNYSDTSKALNFMKTHIINVMIYDSGNWNIYPSNTNFSSIYIPEAKGMWLHLNATYFSPVSAVLMDGKNYSLRQGPNLISYLGVDEETITHVFNNVVGDINEIYYYEDQVWKSYIPGRTTNSLTTVKPGMALWVDIKNDAIWNFKARDDNYFEKVS